MKKFCKYLFVNLILIISIFLLLETFFFIKQFLIEYNISYKDKITTIEEKYDILKNFFLNSYIGLNYDYKYFNKNEIRNIAKPLKDDKKGILLLGCSFTYGDGLKEEEVFSTVLSKGTNRTVYNLGINAGSPVEALYFLKNSNIRKEIVNIEKDIEYVFYTYIPGQEGRILTKNRCPKFKPIKNNTQLVISNIDLLNRSYLFDYFFDNSIVKKLLEKKLKKITNLYFREIRKETYKNFPDSKFIILIYDYEGIDNKSNNQELGFYENTDKVIILNDIVDIDLTSNEYKINDNFHPNGKAWKYIIPALIKETNL